MITSKGLELYRKVAVQAMRPWRPGDDMSGISISEADLNNGSPKEGDMIAVGDHPEDQYLVCAKFFRDKYEPMTGAGGAQEGGGISGYRHLSADEVDAVNTLKSLEGVCARTMETMLQAGADPRCIALSRTKLQEAFMWAVRAVAKPDSPWQYRLGLSPDSADALAYAVAVAKPDSPWQS